MSAKKVKLGNQYKDKVTGFVGTAITRVEFLNGCVRFELAGHVKQGEEGNAVPPVHVVDEQDIVEVDTEKAPARTARAGGARSTAATTLRRKA